MREGESVANPRHLDIVWQGAKAIEAWRKKYPDEVLDLNRAELFKSPTEKIDLRNADLSGADLSYAILCEVDLSHADLSHANLSSANFRQANLKSADLSHTKLEQTKFEGADLTNANLHKSNFSNAKLGGAILNDVDLTESSSANAYIVGAELKRARFARANIQNTDFGGCNLTEANFTDTTLMKCNLSNTILKDAFLYKTDAQGTHFDRADLSNANVIGSVLTDTSLSGADLLGLQINSTTIMHSVRDVTGCKIDRYALEYLRSQKGLTDGMVMDMEVQDDLAILRSQFGGFWGTIHLVSIIIFLAPYIWFISTLRSMAEFNLQVSTAVGELKEGADVPDWLSSQSSNHEYSTITILNALERYIWSGGVDWAGECQFNVTGPRNTP